MQITKEIQWNTIPSYEIDVGNLTKPYEICEIMKNKGTDWYIYRITYDGIVLKYGISADNSKNNGERIYRQIAHGSFWGPLQNHGSSGRDFRGVEDALFDKYGITIDRARLSVKIYDVTNYDFQTMDPFKEIEVMESELVDRYVEATGQKPIGNIEHKKFSSKVPGIPAVLYNDLFREG